ncbi:MAG: endonuclease/exonuclease/phosphatase family protein [Acidimicrobiia bacterium]
MPLRVVTANLFFGRVAPLTLEALVDDFTPDILAAQELVPPLDDVLESRFAESAVIYEGSGLSIGLFLARAGVIERLPLFSYDALLARLDNDLEVITTHIIAPHKFPPWRTARRRIRDLRAIVEHLEREPDRRRILLGDLNSSPVWPAYRRLARYLDDAPRLLAEQNGSRPDLTWGPWPGSPRVARLDHVLVSGLRALSAEVVDLPGSDHRAVVVDVDL